MKKKFIKLGISTLGTAIFLFNIGCGASTGTTTGYSENISGDYHQPTTSQYQNTTTPSPSYQQLSQREIEDILFLREEEKLARDVYLEMYDLYKHRVFANISKSEQVHMNKVKQLIDMYKLPDPVAETGDRRGVFKNHELQNLYHQLVSKGRKSLADALEVGAEIEDLDIADIENRKRNTRNPYLLSVYNMLEKGSENHLRAFVFNLKRLGHSYQPKYISIDKFNEIISRSMKGRGRGRGMGHH